MLIGSLVLFAVIVGAVAGTSAAAPTAAPGRVPSLVDPGWVAAHLAASDVRLVDVSSTRDAYAAGHLPGAVYVDWQADLVDPTHRVRGMAPTREQFQALMRRLGVRTTDAVILYDDTSSLFAARAFWIFKLYRHPRVAILDGGSRRWQLEARPLTTEAPVVSPSRYAAAPRDDSIVATAEYLVARLGEGVVCDARSPQEYAGLDVRSARGGRIPGAVNIDWRLNVAPDGSFKPVAELRALYARAGHTRDREIIVYCQTGVRAAHNWFVLKYLLGYPRVRNYDGSWEEWGNRADLPIQR
ncbi:MAG: sulfurtransferase [Armatimonadota bacterium]|nr:sulfurtransferase [Armatimonadota bacterium]MDR7548419.1 sulfurtransferase [Armatimonadota bacterium]